MKRVTDRQLADVRANVGKPGYPGGCQVCALDDGRLGRNRHNGAENMHDWIVCIKCGGINMAAKHNHVICIACEGRV